MASFNETKKALEGYFATNWTATAIKWQNVAFGPIKDSSGNPLPFVTFVQRETEWPGGGGVALGGPLATRFFRWAGIIINEVHVPENYLDAGLVSRYIGQLIDIWNMQDFLYTDSNGDQANCHVYVPYPTDVGIVDGWYIQYLTSPYRRDSQS